ncbi:hypothetical protein ACHAXN_010049, partial [Cyclotella atomus]
QNHQLQKAQSNQPTPNPNASQTTTPNKPSTNASWTKSDEALRILSQISVWKMQAISDKPTQNLTSQEQCQIRRRSDFFLLFIGICILALAIGHIWLHNPHYNAHHELKTEGGVHGSLEGFVTDGGRRRGKANKVKETVGLNDNARQEVEMTSDEKVKANEGGADRTGNTASDAKPVIKEVAQVDRVSNENTAAAPTSKPSSSPATSPPAQSTENNSNETSSSNQHKIINPSDSIHPVAHLSCKDHGGPSDAKIIDEMIFWSDIPSDASYVSPMYEEGHEKYLTFEPVLSHAMGRTLVLPPEQGMYLIDKKNEGQKSKFSFNDFFHLDAIAIEHKGFKVITTEEFLRREAITGVANTPTWDPWECAVAIPASKEQSSIDELNTTLKAIMDGSYGKPKPRLEEFNGNPTPVDAPLGDRMREMLADRPGLCIYDKPLQEEKLIHLKVHGGVRLLTHFYAFIFFADWKQDLWSKRFVRDHLRYVDEIVCAAARVVEAVRDHARKNKKKPSMEEGIFDAMHVRGDFQYTPTRLPADQLYDLSKNEFTEGATLYVATDEGNKTFFEPFKDKYDVVFLDDFMHVIPDINTNYYGMIDQLVSYKSRVFYGTWWSTLSGYVNRMRGYYITKHKLEGWEDGTMQSWYFTPEERRLQMRSYIPVRKPIYCKEFAVAWRDIDKGIDSITQ